MYINQKKLAVSLLLGLPLFCASNVYAAQAINLRHQPISVLKTFSLTTPAAARGALAMKEINRHVDLNKTLHVRIQQTYQGYDIWGADAIVHIPNGASTAKSFSAVVAAAQHQGSMNGNVYQNLTSDLANASPLVFTQAQAQKALQLSIANFEHQAGGKSVLSQEESKLMVFVADDGKAHWAYKVSFRAEPTKVNEKPVKQVSIIDANSMQTYVSWDDIQTLEKADVDGGGFGGNIKMGKMVYDGATGDLAKLMITRDASANTCFLQNADVTVKDYTSHKSMSFKCDILDTTHNNVYWDADFDAVNSGYSPGNDAFFGGQVIKHMYKEWYGMHVLTNQDGSPMMLNMIVHERNYDNAYWDGRQMTFGDGYTMFYPLTSLGVAAHEISHGFTQQHSNLQYYGQSGGMNEAFSDMAAQAAEVFAYGAGKNSWQIGPEIFKQAGRALRYMDLPSKDCNGGKSTGRCSIDDATQYTQWLDVHYSSGVYNRFFYTLGTTADWDAKKAFDVMVHANSSYWTSTSTFKEAACGVIKAAQDLGYNTGAVKKAFDVVKVDYSAC
jgi:pseudolysin